MKNIKLIDIVKVRNELIKNLECAKELHKDTSDEYFRGLVDGIEIALTGFNNSIIKKINQKDETS